MARFLGHGRGSHHSVQITNLKSETLKEKGDITRPSRMFTRHPQKSLQPHVPGKGGTNSGECGGKVLDLRDPKYAAGRSDASVRIDSGASPHRTPTSRRLDGGINTTVMVLPSDGRRLRGSFKFITRHKSSVGSSRCIVSLTPQAQSRGGRLHADPHLGTGQRITADYSPIPCVW